MPLPPISQNPFLPPANMQRDGAPSGLWRDGKRLVVQPAICRFPRICIRTGVTNDITYYDVNKPSFPEHPTVRMFFALAIILAIFAGGVHGRVTIPLGPARERQPVNVGISRAWLARWQRHGLIGSLMIFGGALAGILGTVAFVFVAMQGMRYEAIAEYTLMPLILVSFLIPVVGVFYLFFTQGALLSQTATKGDYMWFAGAHPDFLATLPPWKT